MIEELCIEILSLAIEAAFQNKDEKIYTLKKLRVKNGVLQNLIRTENELSVLDDKAYFRISEQAIDISKQTNNWLNSLTQKESA